MPSWVRTVQGRLLLGAALLFVAFTLAVVMLVRVQHAVLDASHDATRTTRLLATSAALEKAVVDLETGQRGYALTREQRFLSPWRRGRADIERIGEQLASQVRSQIGEERVRELRILIDAYLHEYSEPFVASIDAGAPIEQLRRMMPLGKQRVDAIRERFEEFGEVRLARVERDERDAERLGERARRLAFVIWVLLAAVLVVLVYLFGRAVVRPIARVRAGVQRVAEGDLSARVDGGTLPETAMLAESFNEMAQRLQEARAQLDEQRRRVEEHAAALERSNADLEQFAYAAAHDLQEPLRTVASYTELIARRYRGQLDADADEFIEFAVQGATRMQALIRALLSYSRVNTRSGEPEAVALGDLVADVERSLSASIDEAGARVERGSDLPAVHGDRVQLELVVQNLVANAIKFRGERSPLVRVSACVSEDDPLLVQVRVDDNGIGIEPQYRERVFRLFQRLNKRDEYAGTGIGLTLVRRIVERHGGAVSIDESPDGGTRIAFTVPVAPAFDAAQPVGTSDDHEGASPP